MFKSLSCWNQQTSPLSFFFPLPQAGSWQWKMSAFSGSERGNETEKCFFFFLFFLQNRAGGLRTQDSTLFAWPYKGFCNCCLLWYEDPPQWAEGKPLLSLINSMRWLDGSVHTAFGVQFSSPYQLALATSTNCKANKNTALCIDLHTFPSAAGRWRGRRRAPPQQFFRLSIG